MELKDKFPIWKILISLLTAGSVTGNDIVATVMVTATVVVLVAVLILGTTELMFIEPDVKINDTYYGDVLLGQHLLPAIRSIAGDFFTFQQDSALALRAGDTVEFLSRNNHHLTVDVAAQ